MNTKLINEVTQAIKEEQENKELEMEKRNIRVMLSLIEDKKIRIERLKKEMKELQVKLSKEDYSLVSQSRELKFTIIRQNGQQWSWLNSSL